MKLIATLVAFVAVFAVACGGDDNGGGGGGNNVVIPAADANRVAKAALPTVAELPGQDWLVVSEDDFGEDGGNEFLEMMQGTPECEALENLATLGGMFGDSGTDSNPPVGRAQIGFEHQDPDALIPTSIEVEVEVKESAAGSRAEFTIVRELFESDDTSRCLITVLNNQFAQGGPAGLTIEVKQGDRSVSAPQGGARMAFDIEMALMGIEIDMAMKMFFWPYGNASVEAMFIGDRETLTNELVQNVLSTVDRKLQAAAGQ